MGDIIMKKITKRSCYQIVSILIFCGAIVSYENQIQKTKKTN